MIFVIIVAVMGAAYLFLTGVTWLIQAVITGMTGQPTEFWPVFLITTAFIVLYNVAAYKEVRI